MGLSAEETRLEKRGPHDVEKKSDRRNDAVGQAPRQVTQPTSVMGTVAPFYPCNIYQERSHKVHATHAVKKRDCSAKISLTTRPNTVPL